MTGDEARNLNAGESVILAAEKIGGKPTFGRVESVSDETIGIKWDGDGFVTYYDPEELTRLRHYNFRSRLSRTDALERLGGSHPDDV